VKITSGRRVSLDRDRVAQPSGQDLRPRQADGADPVRRRGHGQEPVFFQAVEARCQGMRPDPAAAARNRATPSLWPVTVRVWRSQSVAAGASCAASAVDSAWATATGLISPTLQGVPP
jgi:hypothetical protein